MYLLSRRLALGIDLKMQSETILDLISRQETCLGVQHPFPLPQGLPEETVGPGLLYTDSKESVLCLWLAPFEPANQIPRVCRSFGTALRQFEARSENP